MISDSPYRTGELVLSPLGGLIGGMLGAGLMLIPLALLQPVSHVSVADVLNTLGVSGEAGSRLVVGAVLHVALGGLLGLLYALSEQRGPRNSLVFVGLFYGFVLWVLGAVIAASFLSQAARSALRNAPFLSACLFYGLWLALLAVWADSRRPAASPLPQD